MNKIEFVLVLVFTFFVIVVWITSEVILVKPNVPEDPKIQAMLEPIPASFDQETITLINNQKAARINRQVTTPTAIPTPQPTPISSLRPTPTPRVRAATSSAQPSIIPVSP